MLKCVDDGEAKRIMYEVHDDIYDAHKSGLKMRWLIHRYGYYWPTIAADCTAYAKGCEACQMHGTEELHAIVRPWPFRD